MNQGRARIAVLDNYDSFTHNLVQYLAELGAEPVVHRNDEVTAAELAAYDALVISPGPGTPNLAGVSVDAVRRLSGRVPILGVCLGHQAVGEAFGAAIVRTAPVHGMTSLIHHDEGPPFGGISGPFEATRYHSLVVARESVPACLEISAWTLDGLVMGLRHREHSTFGVQFHPESVLTGEGKRLLGSFLQVVGQAVAR